LPDENASSASPEDTESDQKNVSDSIRDQWSIPQPGQYSDDNKGGKPEENTSDTCEETVLKMRP